MKNEQCGRKSFFGYEINPAAITKWIICIRIFRAINMQAQINSNEWIAKVAKLLFFVGENEQTRKKKYKRVFHKPVFHIGSAYKRTHPYRQENNTESKQPFVF